MGCFVADRSLMMWDVVLEKRFCKDAGFCVGDRTLEKCVVFCWKQVSIGSGSCVLDRSL